MRDLIAGLVAFVLLVTAVRLATTLRAYRRRRADERGALGAMGRRMIAELPAAADLILFTEDDARFYYGARTIDKEGIQAVRVLINGSPIGAYISRRLPSADTTRAASFEDRPDGLARDRWDVAISARDEDVLVSCGAIRERVSQELARKVFDAVAHAIEARDRRAS